MTAGGRSGDARIMQNIQDTTHRPETDPVDGTALRSPFHDHLGFQLLEWRENFARMAVDLQPHHLNRHGIPHGGVILAMLDETGAAAGNWSNTSGQVRRSVTVDLNAHFTGRAHGGRVIATARIASQGRSIFFASTEIHDAHGTLIAFGSSTHRRSRESHGHGHDAQGPGAGAEESQPGE